MTVARPLIISDCDEVLLHMVAPFAGWLAEAHDVHFQMTRQDFASALTYADTGDLVAPDEVWRLMNLFFTDEMHRQYPISGAVAALHALAEHADVVVLTNLQDHYAEARTAQLAEHNLPVLRVYTNQGPKGPALKAIIEAHAPSRAFFIDDIAQHLESAAELTPDVTRLHLCGDAQVAAQIRCAHQAGAAHARIDDWDTALPWLLNQIKDN